MADTVGSLPHTALFPMVPHKTLRCSDEQVNPMKLTAGRGHRQKERNRDRSSVVQLSSPNDWWFVSRAPGLMLMYPCARD